MADNPQVSQKKENEKSVNLLSLNVVRRDGSISSFKSDKISDAIKKAFLAQTKIRNNKDKDKEQEESIHKTVEELTHKVVSALTRRIADGDMIHIEDIQDQVELALMRDEHHKVARAYVLYREQRAASRYHTKKLKEQVGAKASSMAVTKRNGDKEPISLDKITNRVSVLSTGLNIDPIVVVQKAVPGLYNEITSTEIDTYLAETAASLTVEHPDYSYLAARIKANALHKETPGFLITSRLLYEDGLLNEVYYNKIKDNSKEIESLSELGEIQGSIIMIVENLLNNVNYYTSTIEKLEKENKELRQFINELAQIVSSDREDLLAHMEAYLTSKSL